MSAASDHDKAQAAVSSAQTALNDLNDRIAIGDTSVTGNHLAAAEADLAVAERLEFGARARAEEERDAAEAAARQDAIASLLARYRATSRELTDAIQDALGSLSRLLEVSGRHRENARTGLSASGLSASGAVPGYGRLITPSPSEVVEAVQVLAAQELGIAPTVMHPHLIIEPIAPFLPTPVGAN